MLLRSHSCRVRLSTGQAPVRPAPRRRVALVNAGVPPTQVADWTGHSVNVLPKVYAKCVYVQDEVLGAAHQGGVGVDGGCRSAGRHLRAGRGRNFPRIATQQP